MPGGYAVWPAFWLVGLQRGETSAEIDIVEYYGRRPDIYMSSSHVWRKSAPPTSVTRPTTAPRSEEHTSELQSLMRISSAVFCLKKKNKTPDTTTTILSPNHPTQTQQ